MHITEFQPGDIIQRVEPTDRACGVIDRSWIGQPFRLEWLEKNILFVTALGKDWSYPNRTLSMVADEWANGWDYYPVEKARELGMLVEEKQG